MIDLVEGLIKDKKGLDRFITKYFNSLPARYACRNLKDFLENRHKLKCGEHALLQDIYYYPEGPDEHEMMRDIIRLRDESGDIPAFVINLNYNIWSDNLLRDDLEKVCGGDTLRMPIIRNGMPTPPWLDNNVYLEGFVVYRMPKSKFDIKKAIDNLLLPEPELAPAYVPVRR